MEISRTCSHVRKSERARGVPAKSTGLFSDEIHRLNRESREMRDHLAALLSTLDAMAGRGRAPSVPFGPAEIGALEQALRETRPYMTLCDLPARASQSAAHAPVSPADVHMAYLQIMKDQRTTNRSLAAIMRSFGAF